MKVYDEIEEEDKEKKGSLKIFLGYCAGVGKTYHMLDLARERKKEGVDVVIGYVEKHERKETLELLEGMEILPTKEVIYKAIQLQELDLEKVLERKPQLVIIDEYAHTNPHHFINEKRYEDIKQILEAGIDVYTTLNIQHIESLKMQVKRVTGIKVKEIVPDEFVKMANNIELIDIEPKELLHRIQEGKVYKREKIEEATSHFFSMKNLVQLREIALKYMSNTLEEKTIGKQEKEEMLVLLDLQEGIVSKKIEKISQIADYMKLNWKVLFILPKRKEELSKEEVQFIKKKKEWIKKLGGKIEEGNDSFHIIKIKQYMEQKEIHKIMIPKSIILKKMIRWYLFLKYTKNVQIYIIE